MRLAVAVFLCGLVSACSRSATAPSGDGGVADSGALRWDLHIDVPVALCGNGVVEGSEQCDDGNQLDDGCSSWCRLDQPGRCDASTYLGAGSDAAGFDAAGWCRCGDGIIDEQNGEMCDDGEYNGKGACSRNCILII